MPADSQMIQEAPSSAESPISFARSRFGDFVQGLKRLVGIPSVSFPGFDPKEVVRSSEAVRALLEESGLENVEILRLGGAHPYVYGEWMGAPGKPVVLLYAHHDVQPPGRESVWKSDPFLPEERKGRLYGRGTSDDKAGAVIHAASVFSCLKTGGLPLNVKILIEGEEEIGSPHLETFLKAYAGKLKADAMVLADTENFDTGIPGITTTLRGLVSFDVTVRSTEGPLHSGMWGGPVPDPVQALARMIAPATGADGRPKIAGLPKPAAVPQSEAQALRRLKYGPKDLRRQAALLPKTRVLSRPDAILKSLWREPAFSVNAIQASSRRDCANIINGEAWAHVGLRIVEGMDPGKCLAAMKKHFLKSAPWGLSVEFSNVTASPAWQAPRSWAPVLDAAARSLGRGYGKPAVRLGCGGSIPFAGPFSKVLGAPAILMGVGDPYSRPHSENESQDLGDLLKAIEGEIYLFRELAALKLGNEKKRRETKRNGK